MLERWLTDLARELGVDEHIDEIALLDAAREVAHAVERKAAPLSTFLIGVAVGRTGASVEDLSERTIEAAKSFHPTGG